MKFRFDAEQEEFRATLGRFTDTRMPRERMREVVERAGVDRELWTELVTEMGVAGLHVPEELGGAGFSYEETALVMQEVGGRLTPVPLAATLFAIEAVLRCGSDAQQERYVPGLVGGERVGTLAVTELADLDARTATVQAVEGDGGWQLDGTLATVAHAVVADLLVVPAVAGDGRLGLFVVDVAAERAAGASTVTLSEGRSLDLTRPVAAITLRGAAAVALDGGWEAARRQRVVDTAHVLLAFEAIGTAERALAESVDYARTRYQFNRPIGSFQAIKHKLAEVAIELDAAQGPALYAAMLLSHDAAEPHPELTETALIAKAQASETLRRAAGEMIQVHGGIGFTWEHDAHLYFRRAKAVEWWLGTPGQLRGRLAERVIA